MSTPLFDSALEAGAFLGSQSREGAKIFRARLLKKHPCRIGTPVRCQPHSLARIEIVTEDQLRRVAVHCSNSAPVPDDFSEHFTALIGEPIKAFELSRTLALERRKILDQN